MNQTLDLASLADLRGCVVIASDGVGIGEMNEVVYDYISEQPVWVGVTPSQGVGFRTLLVPVAGAIARNGRLEVAYSADEIRDEPPTDLGAGFDDITEQRHIYAHFALPLDEEREVRVLHAGEDLPDSETTY